MPPLRSHRIREAMRTGELLPPQMGGVVEIDETIYGRASTHPKGRGPFGQKLTNSAHKNVIPSLVDRGGYGATITSRAARSVR